MPENRYDLIVVGTGFASTFFLHEALRHLPANSRILALERGRRVEHSDLIDNRRLPPSERRELMPPPETLYENRTEIGKTWVPSVIFGGASNLWWACTPRMLPEDFRMRTLYGVGDDWPVDYDDLEELYGVAEDLMAVSGPSDDTPFRRSRPYPQPPHRFSEPESRLKSAFPDDYFHQPCARPTRSLTSGRPACCGAGVCGLCPVDSKFTIQNGMGGVFRDARVTLVHGANVQTIRTNGTTATGVLYAAEDGREVSVDGDLVALGAGALFNPYLLLRSDRGQPLVGEGLVEQTSLTARIDLDGLDSFQGSTSITGNGYMFYRGPSRAERAAVLTETASWPNLRDERGKWRQRMEVKFIFEDLREPRNRVIVDPEDESRPVAIFKGRSAYTQRAMSAIEEMIRTFVGPLPVEGISLSRPSETEGHILGTTAMGNDPSTSVVDRHLIHHKVRNLAVLGSSTFPTTSPANPTLTLCALSLWSARHIYSSAGT